MSYGGHNKEDSLASGAERGDLTRVRFTERNLAVTEKVRVRKTVGGQE